MKKEIFTQETINQSIKTPIEIALQIDENGMTSLKNLYEFLEINSSNYSKWCKRNIVNNPFAIENIDFVPIRLNDENHTGGRPTYDYKLTSDFAKQLSMTVKNERGQQARQYFIACETGLKIATQKLKSGNQLNIQSLTDAITTLTNNMTYMQQDISDLKQSQQKKTLPASKYSRWKTNVFNKMRLIQSYVNYNSTKNLSLPNTMKIIFDELQDTYNLDLSEYTEIYKCEYGLDFDTKVETLDIINHYKDIRDMFTLTLDSILEKLHLQENDELKSRRNIFDELAAHIKGRTENRRLNTINH